MKDFRRGGVIPVGAVSKRVSTTLTRPANTTTYAAGDAVTNSTSAPTALTFALVGRTPTGYGSGLIARAVIVDSTSETLKPDLELWLFNASPTPDNDNAAFTPTDAELANLIGVFQFPTTEWLVGTAGTGGNAVCASVQENVVFECGDDLQALYGLLVVRNAYVPVSGEVFTIILQIIQD